MPCEVLFSSSVCLHVLWGHFIVCCRSYNAPSRAAWPALVCPPELQLASKRSCLLMIMNAVCLLNVLSGLTVNLFHPDSGYSRLVHCSPSAATMSLWPRGPSQMNARLIPKQIFPSAVGYCAELLRSSPLLIVSRGIQESLFNMFQSFVKKVTVWRDWWRNQWIDWA